ncbi:MAG: hypothetical protein ACOC78_04165 [Actinomycetota bacterium]
MPGFRGGKAERPEGSDVQPNGREKAAGANAGKAPEPWYQTAREAAQILVSALALYASIKAFMDKIKKRRDLALQEEV